MLFSSSDKFCVALSLIIGIANSAWAVECTPGQSPATWATHASPVPYTPTTEANSITLVMMRHGEKKILTKNSFLENGNMSIVGQRRAQRLPARLQHMFGCPDYIVAPNPNVKIPGGDNLFYYYVRPAGTIEPTATTLAFPLWMPYGADETPKLAADLLTAPEFSPTTSNDPKKVFIAWEHENIKIMTDYILSHWNLNVLAIGEKVKVDGKTYTCQSVPAKWYSCDFDSIWVLNILGNNVCYSRLQERLNNPTYQKACAKAEQNSEK